MEKPERAITGSTGQLLMHKKKGETSHSSGIRSNGGRTLEEKGKKPNEYRGSNAGGMAKKEKGDL